MTIRVRLTIWYAGVMLVSLLVMGGLMYHQFAPDKRDKSGPGIAPAEETDESDFREALQNVLAAGIPAALIAAVGGWLLMRRALTPVTTLTEAAEKIHDRNLRQQLPRTGNGDELDRLTEVFNAMTARLDAAFTRIREFTLHASHELKTPLTILHGELETMLGEKDLATGQRERLASQLDEIQRLAKIVDGLTLLTKADAGQIELKREPVQLDEILGEVFADAQILGRSARLTVTLAACEPLTVLGDKHRLRQLLLNLADNAVKYNVPGGTVEFSLGRRDTNAQLQVANTGDGIVPDQLPRLFEPFYRGDASHNRTVDGCGLGLSIARWIATAHQGRLRLTSDPGGRTVATLELPLGGA
jgi:signal transduction histidine kinase